MRRARTRTHIDWAVPALAGLGEAVPGDLLAGVGKQALDLKETAARADLKSPLVADKQGDFFMKHGVYAEVEQGLTPELDLIGNDRWQEGAIEVADQSEILRHALKIDLLFCPFSALWPRPVCVPSVVTMADIQEVFYPQFFSEVTLQHRRAHYPGSTRAADSVIAVSEYTKRTIVEHHGIGPDKVFVAYHTTDEAFFEPIDETVVAHLALPERFVFYPANHWLHKNHDGLLKALHYLKHERQTAIPCVLTGFPMAEAITSTILENARLLAATQSLKLMMRPQRCCRMNSSRRSGSLAKAPHPTSNGHDSVPPTRTKYVPRFLNAEKSNSAWCSNRPQLRPRTPVQTRADSATLPAALLSLPDIVP